MNPAAFAHGDFGFFAVFAQENVDFVTADQLDLATRDFERAGTREFERAPCRSQRGIRIVHGIYSDSCGDLERGTAGDVDFSVAGLVQRTGNGQGAFVDRNIPVLAAGRSGERLGSAAVFDEADVTVGSSKSSRESSTAVVHANVQIGGITAALDDRAVSVQRVNTHFAAGVPQIEGAVDGHARFVVGPVSVADGPMQTTPATHTEVRAVRDVDGTTRHRESDVVAFVSQCHVSHDVPGSVSADGSGVAHCEKIRTIVIWSRNGGPSRSRHRAVNHEVAVVNVAGIRKKSRRRQGEPPAGCQKQGGKKGRSFL